MKKFATILLTMIILSLFVTPCYANYILFMSPTAQTLEVGDSSNIIINYENEYISYQSSDPTIATVSENGQITAVSPGQARITAIIQNILMTCFFTVIEKPDMQIGRKNIILLSDETIMVSFKENDADTVALVCQVDDPDIASFKVGKIIDNRIPITMIKGKYGDTSITITATYIDGKTETKTIYISVIKEINHYYYSSKG